MLEVPCLYATVPAWDYQKGIREFMDECNMNAWNPEKCVETIKNRELDRKVINYLCRTKSNNSEAEREKIETLYRTFLLELFTAWNETISKG